MVPTDYILSLIILVKERELYGSVLCGSKGVLLTVCLLAPALIVPVSMATTSDRKKVEEKPYVSNLHRKQQNTAQRLQLTKSHTVKHTLVEKFL